MIIIRHLPTGLLHRNHHTPKVITTPGHTLVGGSISDAYTQYVMPFLNEVLADGLPNLIVTDPKGEFLAHERDHLEELGYDINIISCIDDDAVRWNPLDCNDLTQTMYDLIAKVDKDALLPENREIYKNLIQYVVRRYESYAGAVRHASPQGFLDCLSNNVKPLTVSEEFTLAFAGAMCQCEVIQHMQRTPDVETLSPLDLNIPKAFIFTDEPAYLDEMSSLLIQQLKTELLNTLTFVTGRRMPERPTHVILTSDDLRTLSDIDANFALGAGRQVYITLIHNDPEVVSDTTLDVISANIQLMVNIDAQDEVLDRLTQFADRFNIEFPVVHDGPYSLSQDHGYTTY